MALITKIWKALVNAFRIEYEETKGDTTTRMMYRDEKKNKRDSD